MLDDQDTCRAAGMDDFISKPINAEAFLNVVGRYIGGLDDDEVGAGEISVEALES